MAQLVAKKQTSATPAAKREALRAKIAGYADLPDGFDGYGGHAPAKQDIQNAISFIPHIPDAAMENISPMVAGDGDVGFEWGRDIELEVGFIGGTISFYGDMPDGEEIGADEVYNENAIPEGLRRLMSALFPAR